MICPGPIRDSPKLRSQASRANNKLLNVIPRFRLTPSATNSDAMERWFRPSHDQVPDGGLNISPNHHALTLGGEETHPLGCTFVICLYCITRIKQVILRL